MRTHCFVCRNALSDNTEMCAACGAMFNEGFSGYRGLPMLLLVGRYSTLAAWVSQGLALMVSTMDFGGPALMVVVHCTTTLPLGLTMLLTAIRSGFRGFGILGVCNILMVIALMSVLDATISFTGGIDWSVIGVGAAGLLATGPFVLKFWMHPLPPADMLTCHDCGYLLRGLVVPRCPECGRPFDARKLRRLTHDQPGSVRRSSNGS